MDDSERLERLLQIENRALEDDAQEFLQVTNLTGGIETPRVWYRYLGADFGASITFRRPGRKRRSEVTVFGPTQSAALEALASTVAALLYPDKPKSRRHTSGERSEG